MRAARKQRDQDRQVPRREQPLSAWSPAAAAARAQAQPAALGEIVEMFNANRRGRGASQGKIQS